MWARLLPPAKVGNEHYLDGGIVNSVPLGRAVSLGATRVFVLQVGRLDRPLKPPRRPWEVARVNPLLVLPYRAGISPASVKPGN